MKKLLYIFLAFVCFLLTLPTLSGCQKTQNAHTRYEITAEYIPESRAITGAVKLTFENPTQNELSVLKFQMYPNAYRKNALYQPISTTYRSLAYYNGESYGEMTISSVNGAKNWDVMGEDENILYVFLECSLFPGDKVVLDISFITKLANVNHHIGVTEKTVNLGYFFPILCGIKHEGFYETVYYAEGDPFYIDCADYKATLVVPKEYTLATSGNITEERVLESKKVYTMYATNMRSFAMVLSTFFQLNTAMVGGKSIFYYHYADKEPQKTLLVIKEAFCCFEETFGEYPYNTFSVTQTGFCTDGMDYSGLVMISDRLTEQAQIRAIAHEIAHQWWGATVGNDQIENAWQDEGLAEYSALLFFENYEKYGFTREEMVTKALREYRSYYDVYGSVLGRTNTQMTRHLKEFLGEYEYRCITYDKSLVMFDTLRKSVGDKKFISALRKYYSLNRFVMAQPEDLIGSFEKVGLDVSGFFDSFLGGKAIL